MQPDDSFAAITTILLSIVLELHKMGLGGLLDRAKQRTSKTSLIQNVLGLLFFLKSRPMPNKTETVTFCRKKARVRKDNRDSRTMSDVTIKSRPTVDLGCLWS